MYRERMGTPDTGIRRDTGQAQAFLNGVDPTLPPPFSSPSPDTPQR